MVAVIAHGESLMVHGDSAAASDVFALSTSEAVGYTCHKTDT